MKIITSLHVTENSAAIAHLSKEGDQLSLIDIWQATPKDTHIFRAATKHKADYYVVSPAPKSKDESFFAEQLERNGEKNVEIFKPFKSEIGLSLFKGLMAMDKLNLESCEGKMVLLRSINHAGTAQSSVVMAFFQALLFAKGNGTEKQEFGFGMSLGTNPGRVEGSRSGRTISSDEEELRKDPNARTGRRPRGQQWDRAGWPWN